MWTIEESLSQWLILIRKHSWVFFKKIFSRMIFSLRFVSSSHSKSCASDLLSTYSINIHRISAESITMKKSHWIKQKESFLSWFIQTKVLDRINADSDTEILNMMYISRLTRMNLVKLFFVFKWDMYKSIIVFRSSFLSLYIACDDQREINY